MRTVTKFEIRELASNSTVYMRGEDYFARGRVKKLHYSPDEKAYTATVRGSEDYHIEIRLDDNGDVDDFSCSCPAFGQYDGACKHIVAVMLGTIESQQSSIMRRVSDESLNFNAGSKPDHNDFPVKPDPQLAMAGTLVNTIVNEARPSGEKIPVHLRVIFFKDPTVRGVPEIELEMGSSQLYSVGKIDDLMNALAHNQKLLLGKAFTLKPGEHGFLPQDQPFIDMLMEVYFDQQWSWSYGASAFSGKRFLLSPSRCRRFLEIASGMENVVWKKSKMDGFQSLLVRSGLPAAALSLVRRSKQMELVLSRDAEIFSVTPSREVLFMKGCFYLPSPDELKSFIPIFEAFSGARSLILPISDQDATTFISEAVPALEGVLPVEVAPEIDQILHKEPLIISLWLDRLGEGISARVIFGYGTTEINPLITEAYRNPDQLLARETMDEARFLRVLTKAGFEPHGLLYALFDEGKIFEFLRERLPELTQSAEVFYSDAFKNLQIRRAPHFSGAIRLNDREDLLEVSFQLEEFIGSELYEFIRSLREKRRYIRLPDGAFISTDQPETIAIAKFIAELGLTEKEINGDLISLPKYKAFYLDQAVGELGKEQFQLSAPVQQLIREIRNPQDANFEIPQNLTSVLRDYQKTGYKWLKALAHHGFGGILADDMGLGKTLQAITLVASDYSEHRLPSLVIAPTSLIYNWREEIEKFAPQLSVIVLDGSKEERIRLLEKAAETAMVITSYPLVRRDIEEMEDIRFAYCFIDEAQHIKNPATLNAKSAKRIKARRYFALTGTPIENSLTELWSIFDFVMPGYLSNQRKFRSKFETPIVKDRDRKALGDLTRRIKPFILRRMKQEVLTELPEKIETKLVCEMTDEQKKVYAAYLVQARSEFEKEIALNGVEKSQIKILALLTRLRQVCCHPALFLADYTGGSGKMDLLRELIEDSLEGGHRLLIFSQFTSMLDMIEDELRKDGKVYLRIDGKTKTDERLKRVHAFNGGAGDVFLVSLKAGGTGLNLTGADTVIHYDPWWNPAVEDQATDRAYRIGQQNVVQVYKLVTRGAIEEKIYGLQQRKRDLVDAVIQPGESFLGKMTPEEIRGLFEG